MTSLYTIRCPYCPWERAHMFPETARKMRDAHIKKAHPGKELQ